MHFASVYCIMHVTRLLSISQAIVNHGILRPPDLCNGRYGVCPGFSPAFASLMGIIYHNSKHWAVAKSMARIPSYAPDRIDHCDSVKDTCNAGFWHARFDMKVKLRSSLCCPNPWLRYDFYLLILI
jgi:hypothetical protein